MTLVYKQQLQCHHCHTSSSVETYYDKTINPDMFERQCELNAQQHRRDVETGFNTLHNAGVPRRYICVIQTNRFDLNGDLYLASDTQRLETELQWVRKHANRVYIEEDVYRFVCVDLRSRVAIRSCLSPFYFPDHLLDELLASVEGRTLTYNRQTQPDEFTRQCQLNEQRHMNEISVTHKALMAQGVPDRYIAILEVPRLNERRTGNMRLYNTLYTLQEEWEVTHSYFDECTYPSSERYVCVDLRDHAAVRQHLSEECLSTANLITLLSTILRNE